MVSRPPRIEEVTRYSTREMLKPIQTDVAASSLASPPPMPPRAKRPKVTTRTAAPAARCRPNSDNAIPVSGATTTKVTTSTSETRFAMVMDSASEIAANSMQKGKTTKMIASSMASYQRLQPQPYAHSVKDQ